nr:PREDICTED: protein Skeletor, isoforms B/C [Bemisia tabaci]
MKISVPYVLIIALLIKCCCCESEQYRGNSIGKLNSYHHQVSGDVFAINETSLLIANFNYDGNGVDTFFWAGTNNRPGPVGFIVPNEYGKTDVLGRYFNKDITISLSDGKKLTDIKWFAIYDLTKQSTFGDVYIPDEFLPPKPQEITQLSSRSHGVSSGPLQLIDAKTIRIPKFTYNGAGTDTYFWVGVGPLPSTKGHKVPDEYGYLDPLRVYVEETINVELPGQLTIFDIDWFSIFNVATGENYGSATIPDNPNVPPSLTKTYAYKSSLPNCIQLHRDFQASWEIFGPQITIQLAGQIGEDDYLAFGMSGASNKARMVGADVTIAYIDGARGAATDYNITAEAACVKVLGQYRGVCRDELVGGQDNNQLHTVERIDGVTIITYRRTLISSDPGDKEYKTNGTSHMIWAIGRLDKKKEPFFHDVYPRGSTSIELVPKEPFYNCVQFSYSNKDKREPWETTRIIDRTLRTYTATLGPAGGKRGYRGITGNPSSGLAWYINGDLIPELWMQRGLTYAFIVHGGNDPHSPEFYNPLIITDEPHGGFDRLKEEEQKNVRVLAGIQFTLRGQPRPTAAGALCLKRHKGIDRRLDDNFPTFKKFNRSLLLDCDKGDPALLEVTPNSSWPDVVYYNSYTHSNMGWKIHIVDSFNLLHSSAIHSSAALVAPICILFVIYHHFILL